MRTNKRIQISFNKGINENIKQNINALTNNMDDSVLYMENWNPNLETHSLLRRPGQLPLRDDNNNALYLNTEDYALVIMKDTTEEKKQHFDEFILHSKLLKASNPKYNDNYVLFIRRNPIGTLVEETEFYPPFVDGEEDVFGSIEATAIVAKVFDIDSIDQPAWFESFAEGIDNPGWYVLGTVRDVERYGESLIFVSTIKSLTDFESGVKNDIYSYQDYLDLMAKLKYKLWPVYIWKLHDLKKLSLKPEEFFNGITIDTSTMQYWKVKNPSQIISSNSVNVLCPHEINSDSSLSEYGIGTVWNGKSDIDTVFAVTDVIPVELDELSGNSNIAPIQILLWEAPMYSTIDLLTSTEPIFNNTNYDDQNITTLNKYFNKTKDFVYKGTNSQYQHIESLEYPNYGFRDNNNKKRKQTNHATSYEYYSACDYIKGKHMKHYAFRWVYNNYVENNMPRPWLENEEIPFLITIVVDGIELLLTKFTYKIKSKTETICPYRFDIASVSNTIFNLPVYPALNIEDELGFCWGKAKTDGSSYQHFLSPLQMGTDDGWPMYSDAAQYNGSPGTIDLQYREINLFFTIRFDTKYLDAFVENNVSSINVYASKANLEDNMMKSLGILKKNDPIQGMYCPPLIKNDKDKTVYDNYGLIKKFVIKGKGQYINQGLSSGGTYEDDWENYSGKPLETNSWFEHDDGYTYAIPQNGDGTTLGILPSLLPGAKGSCFTPDFIIWDYAVESSPLNLQASGEYWTGLGAEILAVIKSRVFLGNCLDDKGNIEQGIIRYSAVQNGIVSQDVFNKEDILNVGHLPYTALIEYREELIIFDSDNFYRLQLNEITNALTWEFVDVITGTGTFSKKTVCVTPHGFCYCNANGIWISTGTNPESLTNFIEKGINITSLFQLLMLNKPYTFASLVNPGTIIVENGYNKYAELIYDQMNDELVFITPVCKNGTPSYWYDMTHELRLIYNFKNSNWRVETFTFSMNTPSGVTNDSISFSKVGKMHISNPELITTRVHFGYTENETKCRVDYSKQDFDAIDDLRLQVVDALPEPDIQLNKQDLIETILITHEIGDGVNDCLLQKCVLDMQARREITKTIVTNGIENELIFLGYDSETFNYIVYPDPFFGFELRNRGWESDVNNTYYENYYNIDEILTNQVDENGFYDLMKRNLATMIGSVVGNINPYKTMLETPQGINTPDSQIFYPKESIILLAPINTKYRRTRFKLKTKLVAKLRNIEVKYVEFTRKTI